MGQSPYFKRIVVARFTDSVILETLKVASDAGVIKK